MARTSAKHTSARLLLLICVGLLGIAVIADYLWAYSPRFIHSYNDIADNWALPVNISKPKIIPSPKKTSQETPHQAQNIDQCLCYLQGSINCKNDTTPGRVLLATFADLPGTELNWESKAKAPVPHLDGAAIQIKNLLFVFAGYIYVVTGQYGPQCRGPTAYMFVFDSETKQWQDMPPLPVPRYVPTTQLWRGRVHVMGGSGENRYTPEEDHWSLAVKDGKVLEKEWRSEIPVPRGGPNGACVVVDDRLYLIGGQECGFRAKPGSPIFKCSPRTEVVYNDVYMMDDEMKWKVLPPTPKPDSHIEFACAVVNHSIVIVSGTTEKHPVTKKMTLVGEIFQFNLNTLKWSVLGKLPFRVKTTLVGFWNGWL